MTETKRKVYIAAPYSRPDQCENTHKAMAMWDRLKDLGYTPFCPHWCHFQHTFNPRPHTDWIEFDLQWIPVCDVLLRLPGVSTGADGEVNIARNLIIPVVSLEEFPAPNTKYISEEDWLVFCLNRYYPPHKTIQ